MTFKTFRPVQFCAAPDSETLVVTVLGGLAMSQISLNHILSARLEFHLTRVLVHVTITATNGSISLCSHTIVRTRLGSIATTAIMGQLHPFLTIFHHEIAEIDVGSAIISTDHVWLLVTMMLAVGQT